MFNAKNNFNAIRSTTIAKLAILVLKLSQICASINNADFHPHQHPHFTRCNIRRSAHPHYTPGRLGARS